MIFAKRELLQYVVTPREYSISGRSHDLLIKQKKFHEFILYLSFFHYRIFIRSVGEPYPVRHI